MWIYIRNPENGLNISIKIHTLAKKLNQEKINPFKDIHGIINNPAVPYFGLKNMPLCLIIT